MSIIACCLLPVACCLLPVACCLLPVASGNSALLNCDCLSSALKPASLPILDNFTLIVGLYYRIMWGFGKKKIQMSLRRAELCGIKQTFETTNIGLFYNASLFPSRKAALLNPVALKRGVDEARGRPLKLSAIGPSIPSSRVSWETLGQVLF